MKQDTEIKTANPLNQDDLPSLPLHVAQLIEKSFEDYIKEFNKITARAKQRFEKRQWQEIHADSKERLLLYKHKYRQLAERLPGIMGNHARDKTVWKQIKRVYSQLIRDKKNYEIAETYYNSVCRRVFNHIPVDEEIMFILPEHQHEVNSSTPIYRTYYATGSTSEIVRQILEDYRFEVDYEDVDRDVCAITEKIEKEVLSRYKPGFKTRVEILKSVFYRNKGAYLVGRIHIRGNILPFVLPLMHDEKGIYVDTIIFDPNDVSIIFSFTRSYFMVEVDVPSEMVRFLHTLMPEKPIEEIYNSIGFNKHGKTEFYRSLLQHLNTTDDKFIIAPGIKGMVMSVFTLPNYNVVFKLIKDKFDPPKTLTREQVRAKYKLVSEHDRVGRMADTHEFVNLEFDRDKFTPELLEELLTVAPSNVEVNGDKVLIKHVYSERKMIPLNLYLETATPEEAEDAVSEYGNAIKQLAAANIFPGDMLLKNFGVTRHGRVVFYDYDEIVFLTECNFRVIPPPRSYDDEMSSEPYFSVGPNDIFPEEFKKFLIGHEHIRQLFYKLHGDIFGVKFWREMQEKQRKGEILDVFPYRRRKRFKHNHNR